MNTIDVKSDCFHEGTFYVVNRIKSFNDLKRMKTVPLHHLKINVEQVKLEMVTHDVLHQNITLRSFVPNTVAWCSKKIST